MQSETVFKICEGISWISLLYVKEFDVIVQEKMYIPCIILSNFLAILYPKSLANLVVEIRTRLSDQILLEIHETMPTFFKLLLFMYVILSLTLLISRT